MSKEEAPKEPRRTVSLKEASEMLGISVWSAYEAAKNGQIPTIKIGRRLLVPVVALDRMLSHPQ